MACPLWLKFGLGLMALAGVASLAGCLGSRSTQADLVSEPAGVRVGWAQTDITPPWPVNLVGQSYLRIAHPDDAHDPLTATAMAIESPDGGHAVLVSLDLVGAYDVGLRWQEHLARRPRDARLNGLDVDRVILFATHTHTGPHLGQKEGLPEGTRQGNDYRAFLYPKLTDIIATAWQHRRPASIATVQAYAPVGFNRVAVYADGSTKMYGDTRRDDFVKMEGPVDHTAEMLYTFDPAGNLTGVLINLASPAQVLEGKRYISADFWHEVRIRLRDQTAVPDDLPVLAMCGAAGDQAPRDLENPTLTEEDMRGHAGTRSIGKLVSDAVVDSLPEAKRRREGDVVVANRNIAFELPRKSERGDEAFPIELHAVRIANAVVVDNPFELYTAYGLEIKRRSAAEQTFIAQLASGPAYGMYLPTPEAIPGGAYGSRINNGQVGPAGGKMLVDRTVEVIDHLFNRTAREDVGVDR